MLSWRHAHSFGTCLSGQVLARVVWSQQVRMRYTIFRVQREDVLKGRGQEVNRFKCSACPHLYIQKQSREFLCVVVMSCCALVRLLFFFHQVVSSLVVFWVWLRINACCKSLSIFFPSKVTTTVSATRTCCWVFHCQEGAAVLTHCPDLHILQNCYIRIPFCSQDAKSSYWTVHIILSMGCQLIPLSPAFLQVWAGNSLIMFTDESKSVFCACVCSRVQMLVCDYTHVRAPGDTMHKNLMTGQSTSDNPQIAGG